jgi:S1-C subfamily serine protease
MRTIASVGIEVVAVRQGGAAARAGIEAGDIIVRLDGRDAPDTNLLQRAFRDLAAGAALVLTVQRGTDYRVVALEKR